MTGGDDHGAGDDPQLTSLRSMWRSLPDDEPAPRGLAELMAAARAKADVMAAPSLWQRITAAVRRPAVLALATVLVVIGGGIFLGRRADTLAVTPVQRETAPDTAALAGPHAPAAPIEGAPSEAPVPPADEIRSAPPRNERPRRSIEPTQPAPTAASGADEDTAPDETPVRERAGLAPSAAFEAPPAATLIAQAKAAAARGDCAHAAGLLKRVATTDEVAHRKALATDAALEACTGSAR